MRINIGDVTLWFDVSGPSVVAGPDAAIERPTLVTVHGGPGVDHLGGKAALAPLAERVQVLYYDQRGHGRSDRSTADCWNLRTWAYDLRRLCDVLGLVKPVVLGSSFGGHVALTYAGLYPDHPGGIILANTTGGRPDRQLSVEIFRRLGGDEAAAAAERDYAEHTEESLGEFRRVCLPLCSSTPIDAEELRRRRARSIQTTEVNRHYFGQEAARFDAWSLLGMVTCPALVLAGEDDPICPLPVAEDLARRLPADTTTLVRLPGARHAIFRDRPDIAFPAVEDFIARVNDRARAQTAGTAQNRPARGEVHKTMAERATVRVARSGDGAAIAAAWLSAGTYYADLDPAHFQVPSTEGLAAGWDDRFAVHHDDALHLVAEVDGHVVGWLSARLELPDDGAAVQLTREHGWARLVVDALVVDRDYWRHGAGTALLEAAEAWGRDLGAQVVRLDTYAHSPISVPFYEDRMGYQRRSILFQKQL